MLPLLFWGCSTSQYYKLKETRKLIDNSFQDTLYAHANWGILIESVESEEILYELNADKMFIPASNQKIITSAVALLTLGAEFKYETKLYYSGEIVDSVLIGNLVIQGFGDPTLSTEFYDDPRMLFYCWADTLIELGISQLNGNIIGDDNVFDDNRYGMDWAFDDLNYGYAAEIGALQFNENSVNLQIIPPMNLNDSVKIIPDVKSSYFSIFNDTSITKNGKTKIKIDRLFGVNDITISGNITLENRRFHRSVSISNPTLYFVTALKEVLTEKGIQIEGDPLDCDKIKNWELMTEKWELITTYKSLSLSEILQVMMKESKNLYAETILKTMGWQQSGIGSFAEGKNVVDSVLTDWGIDAVTYSYCDGSGLSRYNLISPRQIVKVLKKMQSDENWFIWRELFPIAGVDGTLKYRMIETPGEGNVKAKTGTMSNVRCLSGYLTTSSNKEIVFSFLVNGHLLNSKDLDSVVDHILNLIIGKR